MRECNACENRKCYEVEKFRNGKSVLTTENMQGSCPRVLLPGPWKIPLVLHALVDHAQGVHDVLQEHNMVFAEWRNEKPYFKIYLEEKSQ